MAKRHKHQFADCYLNHIDRDWIDAKIDGHGGSWSCGERNSLAQIGYIGGTSRFKIMYYNLILLSKYWCRKIKKIIDTILNV
jgi:hypothetical protein